MAVTASVFAIDYTTDGYNRVTVQASTRPVIEIREKMFMAQVSDVYLNTSDYADNSWVEAIGILRVEQLGYYQSLYLELSSLTVLNKRGAENVRQ
jgi:hypothetical protein